MLRMFRMLQNVHNDFRMDLALAKVRCECFRDPDRPMWPCRIHFWPQFNDCMKIQNWNYSFHLFRMIINSAIWGAVRGQTVIMIAQREARRIERNGRGVRRGSKLLIVVFYPRAEWFNSTRCRDITATLQPKVFGCLQKRFSWHSTENTVKDPSWNHYKRWAERVAENQDCLH